MACDSARIYEGVVVGPKRLGERHAFAVEVSCIACFLLLCNLGSSNYII